MMERDQNTPRPVANWPVLPLMFSWALILFFYFKGSPQSHESASLLLVLNFLFTTLVSMFIAALAGRGFLITGLPALLAICVGMTVWAFSAGWRSLESMWATTTSPFIIWEFLPPVCVISPVQSPRTKQGATQRVHLEHGSPSASVSALARWD